MFEEILPEEETIEEVPEMEENGTEIEESNDNNSENVPKEQQEKQRRKDIIIEMRYLLQQYPLFINFDNKRTVVATVNNILLLRELMIYCKEKTRKVDIATEIQEDIDYLEKEINFTELYKYMVLYNESTSGYGKQMFHDKMLKILKDKFQLVSDGVQIYSLIVPTIGKKYNQTTNVHGLSGAEAIEFENAEIEKGDKVQPNQAFKIDEEGVVELLDK